MILTSWHLRRASVELAGKGSRGVPRRIDTKEHGSRERDSQTRPEQGTAVRAVLMCGGLELESGAQNAQTPARTLRLAGVTLRGHASRSCLRAEHNLGLMGQLPTPRVSATPNDPGGVMLLTHPPSVVTPLSVCAQGGLVKGMSLTICKFWRATCSRRRRTPACIFARTGSHRVDCSFRRSDRRSIIVLGACTGGRTRHRRAICRDHRRVTRPAPRETETIRQAVETVPNQDVFHRLAAHVDQVASAMQLPRIYTDARCRRSGISDCTGP